jgi:hypothetical protein
VSGSGRRAEFVQRLKKIVQPIFGPLSPQFPGLRGERAGAEEGREGGTNRRKKSFDATTRCANGPEQPLPLQASGRCVHPRRVF